MCHIPMKYKPLTSVEIPLFVIGHPLFSSVTFRPIHENSGLKPVAHTIEETGTIRPFSNLGCPLSIPATRGTCSTPAEKRSDMPSPSRILQRARQVFECNPPPQKVKDQLVLIEETVLRSCSPCGLYNIQNTQW